MSQKVEEKSQIIALMKLNLIYLSLQIIEYDMLNGATPIT